MKYYLAFDQPSKSDEDNLKWTVIEIWLEVKDELTFFRFFEEKYTFGSNQTDLFT